MLDLVDAVRVRVHVPNPTTRPSNGASSAFTIVQGGIVEVYVFAEGADSESSRDCTSAACFNARDS